MTEDGWSPPKIYGTPIPLPSDASALAVETAQPDTGDAWSAPIYHGPRRRRPRSFEQPAEQPVGAGAAAGPLGAATAAPPRAEPPGTGPSAAPDAPAQPSPATAAPGEPPQDEPVEPSLMASSRTMAIASMVSRVTGFLRSVAIAAAVGAGLYSVGDAYGLANTLPNMVYELLLGGVLTSVLIPVLVKAQQDDQDRGLAYTQRLLSIATVGLGGATLLAVLAAPWLIGIFGGPPQYRSVAALWATLLLPEIFFYGLGAMIAAILNSRHIFGWPAWAPVMNNLITIAAALLFLLVPGPAKLSTGNITNTQILVLGIGTTLGIAAQALVLLVPLRRSGFVWKWRFRASPNEAGRMAEFRTLTLWVLGYVVVSQLGVVVINRVANQNGGVQIFAFADLLFMVPYGILGVSLLTALMPRMSRSAARGDTTAVLADLELGSRLSAVALVPISVGLMVFGPAFTSVILLGRYSQSNAQLTGLALAAGAFGLVPFAVVMLQQRVFYAMRDARTPTFINVAMVATKIALVLAGSGLLEGRAVIICLTVSTSASYLVGCLVGHQLLRRHFGQVRFAPVARTVGWIAAASAAAGVVGLLVVLAGNAVLGGGRLAALAELVVGGTLAGVVLVLLALRLPLPEVAQIASAVRGRAGRDPAGATADATADSRAGAGPGPE
ncbi:MAG TPA: murein biosynthesis integral membrane protein MurJ [Jatrophihabitans sp.]|jgi:putative peptidoglycan lipid II flippase|uniref:murein biosynthesis integral membrane protein MurJ n=1 Tax=Jatrophihabitans sp. TaxID=1932789 RepID=UPI002F0FA210